MCGQQMPERWDCCADLCIPTQPPQQHDITPFIMQAILCWAHLHVTLCNTTCILAWRVHGAVGIEIWSGCASYSMLAMLPSSRTVLPKCCNFYWPACNYWPYSLLKLSVPCLTLQQSLQSSAESRMHLLALLCLQLLGYGLFCTAAA